MSESIKNNQDFWDFITKDSGERQEFSTGARRDVQTGKPRYDLISLIALYRWAIKMGQGAEKYGDRNWEKGIPLSRFYASMFRHMMQWAMGDTSEDHLAAVLFNAAGIMHTEQKILDGELPASLGDAGSIVDFLEEKINGRNEGVGETSTRNGESVQSIYRLLGLD